MEIQEVIYTFLRGVTHEEWVTLLTVLTLSLGYNMHFFSREKKRIKRIAIIEDSDSDFMMFKFFFHLDNVVIDRYMTADDLPLEFAKNKPEAVIADYILDGPIKGDLIIKLCDKFDIPSVLITGYEGKIQGVDPKRIILKSTDRSYFNKLQLWAGQYV